ncbi:MAG: helix-turn-helix transcriptional regulator [Microbacteriaceae bacterium]|nr:helix-turn-helix transcriptional regulator [Microbacteriaceae bacterium]
MRDDFSEVFPALAHPTRRMILQDLASGEQAAGAIAAQFSSTGPTISRHLSVLKSAGLVHERREANRIIYSVNSVRLAQALEGFLAEVCPGRISIPVTSTFRDNRTGQVANRTVETDTETGPTGAQTGKTADETEYPERSPKKVKTGSKVKAGSKTKSKAKSVEHVGDLQTEPPDELETK